MTKNDGSDSLRRTVVLSGAGIIALPAVTLLSVDAAGAWAGDTPEACSGHPNQRVASDCMSDVMVSVATFGAIGDGISDDTQAIQSALNAGNLVLFPSSRYRITSSLMVGSQRLMGLGTVASRAQTLLFCDGNFPAFINRPDQWDSFSIDGFFVDFGEMPPTDPETEGSRFGFRFTGEGTWPEQMIIRNCVVRGAWYGYYDDTGTYMSILERVEARHCRIGFVKRYGTTITFLNCFVRGEGRGARQGFVLSNILSPTLISCAADQLAPQSDDVGGAANYFEGISGLSIFGWDAEGNRIGPNLAYMKFSGCTGDVRGFTGYQNQLHATAPDETCFIWSLGSNLTFSGSTGRSDQDLVYEGEASVAVTILASEGGEVFVQGATIWAPVHPEPSMSYALAGFEGRISYSATRVVGKTVCVSRLDVPVVNKALPAVGIGAVGLFLNSSSDEVSYGDVVDGIHLLPASASGEVLAPMAPDGTWTCLGQALGNAIAGSVGSDCVTLFQRIS